MYISQQQDILQNRGTNVYALSRLAFLLNPKLADNVAILNTLMKPTKKHFWFTKIIVIIVIIITVIVAIIIK